MSLSSEIRAIMTSVLATNEIVDQLIPDDPIMDIAKKKEAKGSPVKVPVNYGHSASSSANAVTAETNAAYASDISFEISGSTGFGRVFSGFKFSEEEMLSTRGAGDKALYDAVKRQMESAMAENMRQVAQKLYDTGTGAIGRIASGEGTATITLLTVQDAAKFKIGDRIVASATETGALRSGTAVITGIDRNAGTLTTSGNWSTVITSAAANDWLFKEGDAPNNVATNILSPRGLQAWLPYAAPSGADSFFGVNRSVDTALLAGSRRDGSSQTITDALIDLLAEIDTVSGAYPTHVIMHKRQLAKFAKENESKKSFQVVGATGPEARTGFTKYLVALDGINVIVTASRFCPVRLAYALNEKEIHLLHKGQLGQPVAADGEEMLRRTGAEFTGLMRSYVQLALSAPGHMGVVQLAAL